MTASASPFARAGQQGRPWAHLDVAGRVDLEADGARHIDVEARQDVVFVEVVERGKVAVGEKPDRHASWRLAFGAFRIWGRSLRRKLGDASDNRQKTNKK